MAGEVAFDFFTAFGVEDFAEVACDEVVGIDAAASDGEDDGIAEEDADHAGEHHEGEVGRVGDAATFGVGGVGDTVAVGVDHGGLGFHGFLEVDDGGLVGADVAGEDEGDVFGDGYAGAGEDEDEDECEVGEMDEEGGEEVVELIAENGEHGGLWSLGKMGFYDNRWGGIMVKVEG